METPREGQAGQVRKGQHLGQGSSNDMMLRCHAIYKWMSPFPFPKQEMASVGKGMLGRTWGGRWNNEDAVHPPAALSLSRHFRGCLPIFSPTPPHRLQLLPETPCHRKESLPLPRDNTFLEFPQSTCTTSICGRKALSKSKS